LEQEFLDIRDLSQCLKMKKSNLYARVEDGTLPHYRIGRLIRFKKADIDRWLESQKREPQNIPFPKLFKPKTKANPSSIDGIVKRAIAEAKGLAYNPAIGKPDRVKGLSRKEEKDGAL
jgi:excisionase family DNA binding protein